MQKQNPLSDLDKIWQIDRHSTQISVTIAQKFFCCQIFTARCYASAVLATALCRSVRLSVCPSQVGVPVPILRFKVRSTDAWRARRARAYNGGLGRSPQRGPGAKPLVSGVQGGEAPLKLKAF